jgi:diguanylate cyclase (GGDEF)-like protein
MGSFKVKLVAYFLLLALIPLAAAFWGFSSIAARSETRTVDARLQSSLRAGLAGYQSRLDAAGARAEHLAKQPAFASALLHRDRAKLARFLVAFPRLRVSAPGFTLGGATPRRAAARTVSVYGPHGPLGTLYAWVPLDAKVAAQLSNASVLAPGDRFTFVDEHALRVPPGTTTTVRLDGHRYRGVASPSLQDASGTSLAILTPQSTIDVATSRTELRLLAALLATLLLVGIVAWLEGRGIVRSVRRLVGAANAIARGDLARRVPVNGRDELALLARSFNEMAEQLGARLEDLESERERLQDAITLFGEALAATHDIAQLLRVVLDVEIEATGASGGLVIVENGEVVQVGDIDGDDRIEVPLNAGRVSFGRIVLIGSGFDDEDRITAVSLAAHAVVALENARLHRIVEQQALVDGLTGLANRRHAEASLQTELQRAERFGGPLAFVLCDLDGFKTVNDRFGHLAGDDVLRELAVVLRETVRVVDVAARWGGEEFALILPETDAAGGQQLAERAREALESRTILTQEGVPVRVTASFGVAAYPEHGRDDDLVAAADSALYEAKRGGKNRFETAEETVGRP